MKLPRLRGWSGRPGAAAAMTSRSADRRCGAARNPATGTPGRVKATVGPACASRSIAPGSPRSSRREMVRFAGSEIGIRSTLQQLCYIPHVNSGHRWRGRSKRLRSDRRGPSAAKPAFRMEVKASRTRGSMVARALVAHEFPRAFAARFVYRRDRAASYVLASAHPSASTSKALVQHGGPDSGPCLCQAPLRSDAWVPAGLVRKHAA